MLTFIMSLFVFLSMIPIIFITLDLLINGIKLKKILIITI